MLIVCNVWRIVQCQCSGLSDLYSKHIFVINGKTGEAARIHYYGTRIEENRIQQIFDLNLAFHSESYPAFGIIRIMIKLCR